MSTADIFDTVLGDIPEPQYAPDGKYRALVTDVKVAENPKNGNRGRELAFRLLEPLSGQDVTGVNLAEERVRDTIWVTDKSSFIARETVQKMAPDITPATKLSEAFEQLRGREVVIHIKKVTTDRNGAALRFPRIQVAGYEAA